MKNTVFPHKFWRPFLDCMPQLFFRPQYVWFPVHLKGHLIPLCYETLVVNWQNWLFTLFHQSRSVLSPNPIHQPHECLLNRLFRRRSNKTSKLRVTDLCAGNSPVTGEFLAQMASNAENCTILWRHHVPISGDTRTTNQSKHTQCAYFMSIRYICNDSF